MADVPALQEPPEGGGQVTLDEIEEQVAADKSKADKPDYDKLTVDFEGVPESLKGKSVKEVAQRAQQLEEALKISEKAREAAPPAEPKTVYVERQQEQAPAGPAKLTREQVKEMMEQDPLAAFEYMATQSQALIQANTEARVKPLRDATAAAAEQNARVRYAEDFELFGKEIQAIVDKLPDKGALAMPGAWDDVVTYVRGQNVEKIIDHRITKKEQKEREAAQAIAARNTPTGSLATTRGAAPIDNTAGELDPTRKEIAKVLGLSEEEYKKWARAS